MADKILQGSDLEHIKNCLNVARQMFLKDMVLFKQVVEQGGNLMMSEAYAQTLVDTFKGFVADTDRLIKELKGVKYIKVVRE